MRPETVKSQPEMEGLLRDAARSAARGWDLRFAPWGLRVSAANEFRGCITMTDPHSLNIDLHGVDLAAARRVIVGAMQAAPPYHLEKPVRAAPPTSPEPLAPFREGLREVAKQLRLELREQRWPRPATLTDRAGRVVELYRDDSLLRVAGRYPVSEELSGLSYRPTDAPLAALALDQRERWLRQLRAFLRSHTAAYETALAVAKADRPRARRIAQAFADVVRGVSSASSLVREYGPGAVAIELPNHVFGVLGLRVCASGALSADLDLEMNTKLAREVLTVCLKHSPAERGGPVELDFSRNQRVAHEHPLQLDFAGRGVQ